VLCKMPIYGTYRIPFIVSAFFSLIIMIILEPKSDSSSQAVPSVEQPPSYSNDIPMAGRSQPISTPPVSAPPAMGSSRTDGYISTTMTPREEVLVGEEYRLQLLARCAQGNHQPTRHYGVAGIIFAVILFPIGLICLAVDSETNCSRCGVPID